MTQPLKLPLPHDKGCASLRPAPHPHLHSMRVASSQPGLASWPWLLNAAATGSAWSNAV